MKSGLKLASGLNKNASNPLSPILVNGKISIKFGIEDDFVLITVDDNGTGIDKSIISHITEPYYTTKVGNSGLGLAIVKHIIEAHGQNIHVRSTYGKGTTFSFTLQKISTEVDNLTLS